MLRRLYLVISLSWALTILFNGSTKVTGIQTADLAIALLPAVLGAVLWRVGRFVISGR
jgi:hypothetical protein